MAKIDLITVPLLGWPFAVLSVANDPPPSPVLNDCYLIGTAPTGAWAGRTNQIARRNAAAAWEYQAPVEGRTVYDRSANLPRRWDGSSWVEFEASAADIAALQAADAAHTADIAAAAAAAATAQTTANTALAAVPSGGTTGQILAKTSDIDRDTQWITAPGDITSVTAGTGLSGGGTSGPVTISANVGTTAGTLAAGDDLRLTNARAPTSHASTHASAGSDPINVTGLSGRLATSQNADVLVTTGGNLTLGTVTDGQMLVRSGTTVASQAIPVGTITGVTAGAGLTGGGASGAVTVAANVGTSAGTVAAGNDARFSDARTPTAHKTTHATGGSDALTAADVGAVPTTRTITAGTGLTGGGDLSANRSLTVSYGTSAGTAAQGNDSRLSDDRAASGIRTATTLVTVSTAAAPTAGQALVATSSTAATWQTIAVGGGDITDVIAGTGLSGGATSGAATLAVVYGTTAGTSAQGNDTRLSDDRTASAIRTASGTVSVSTAAAPSAGQALVATSATTATWQTVVGGGGGDITAVIAGTGLSGGAASGDATLAVVYGSSAGTAAQGNDSRLSDARTPTPHAASHATGQPDAISPASIGAVPASRAVTAGTGLTGGGDLSADRSLAVSFGSTAGTSAQGNDSRLSDDRTASGLRTASGIVAISTATAPAAGQVLAASGPTAAVWIDRTNVVHASQLRADTALSTTPTTLASVVLPAAGTYNVTVSVRLVVATGAPSTVTGTFEHASIVELAGSWVRSKRNYTVDADRVYAKPTLFRSYSDAVGQMHVLEFRGHVIVSAGATIPVQVALSAGAGLALAGSYVTVTSESANVTPFGPTNFISISSGGVGYAGTILTATSAGQWTADGVAIVGQTGTTYTIVRADEGKELRCGNSNPFQMWTPLHLPDAFKTDGTNWGSWHDPAYAATVTLNGSNVASISNLFAGGPQVEMVTAANQVPYNAGGGYLDYPSTQNKSLGSPAGAALRHAAGYFVTQWADGVSTAKTTQATLHWGGGTKAFNLPGTTIHWAPPTNTNDMTPNFVNGVHRSTAAALPLPMSLLEGYCQPVNTSTFTMVYQWYGRVRECLILCLQPSQGIVQQIRGYMMWHNGIAASISPDSPFYSAPPRIS